MSAIGEAITGASVLADWLGEGALPVPQEHAEQRASTCVGCPNNVEPQWWNRTNQAIGMVIKRQLAARANLGLSVSVESSLHMCRVCGCCMPLKVHVPIQHIRAHTPDGQKEKFPAHCWLRKEL